MNTDTYTVEEVFQMLSKDDLIKTIMHHEKARCDEMRKQTQMQSEIKSLNLYIDQLKKRFDLLERKIVIEVQKAKHNVD